MATPKNKLKRWGKIIAVISGIIGGALTVAGGITGAVHAVNGYLAAQRTEAVADAQRVSQVQHNTAAVDALASGLRRIESGVDDLRGDVKGLSGKVDVLLRLNGGAPALPKNGIARGPGP